MRGFRNPVIAGAEGSDHGDPFVLRHLDRYYLFHTTDFGRRGVSVHVSEDLVQWSLLGHALEGGGPGHWAETDLWAPEVMFRAGVFHMYVAGTRRDAGGAPSEPDRRQGTARSATPAGPYVLAPEPLVPDTWSIDAHPFQDEDGSLWLFYNVRTEQTRFRGRPGSGTLADRLLEPDRLEGAPAPVAFPSADWEGDFEQREYWNEGSWVLKRRGRYHHLYSGGLYLDASYGIGLTSADDPRGPWRKLAANPIFRSGERITGPGHHSVILAPDGVSWYAVYHAYVDGRPGRKVCLDPLFWCGDRPVVGTGRPMEGEQPVPPGPVHDPGVPWWHADLWAGPGELRVAGHPLALGPSDGPWRVRAGHGLGGLRVWVDGELRLQAPGRHAFALAGEAEVRAQSLTSHLSDEAVRWLAPRERNEWAWGGSGPLDVSVAVRGSATLSADGKSASVTSPDGAYALLQLRAEGGAGEVAVTGEGAGARVTDLSITARASG